MRVSGLKYSAIVVNNSQVALECVECLNRHKLPRQTFLPIDGIGNATLEVNLRLIEEPQNVKLIYDVLKFDEDYEPVVLHVVKSTLVCETDENARYVAYEYYATQNEGTRRTLNVKNFLFYLFILVNLYSVMI